MQIFLAFCNRSIIPSLLLACALVAMRLEAQQPTRPKRGAPQTVITMGADYSIVPTDSADDGVHYRLNRLAKDGTIYESINLRKTGNRADGATTYVGPSGMYVRYRDGTLEEPFKVGTAPPVPVKDPRDAIAALTLVQDNPIAAANTSPALTKIESLTLPDEVAAIRPGIVQGRSVTLLKAYSDNGVIREIAVSPAGNKLGEMFYVRISNPTRPNEPLVYGVVNGNTVTAYTQLPTGLDPYRESSSLAVQSAPPSSVGVSGSLAAGPPPSPKGPVRIQFQGRGGTLFVPAAAAAPSQTLLNFDGDPLSLAVESVRGSNSVFTVTRNPDIQLHVAPRGVLTVTDSRGAPAGLPAPDVQNVVSDARNPANPPSPPVPPPAPAVTPFSYGGRAERNTIPRSGYEPPVEKLNADGSMQLAPDGTRQFVLTIHNGSGIETTVPVKPLNDQTTMEHPTIFFMDQYDSSGKLFKHIDYFVTSPEKGGELTIVTAFPPSESAARTANQQTGTGSRTGHRSSTYYDAKNGREALQVEMIYNTGQQLVWKLEVEPGRRIVVFPVEKPGKFQSIAGGLRIPTMNFTFKIFENFGAPDLPAYFLVERKGKDGMVITGSDERPSEKGK